MYDFLKFQTVLVFILFNILINNQIAAQTSTQSINTANSVILDDSDIPIYVRESMESIYRFHIPAGRQITLEQAGFFDQEGLSGQAILVGFYYLLYRGWSVDKYKKQGSMAVTLEFTYAEMKRCVTEENIAIENMAALNECVDIREHSSFTSTAFSFLAEDKIATNLHDLVAYLNKVRSKKLNRLKFLGNLIGQKVPIILVNYKGELVLGPQDGWATIEEVFPQPQNSRLIKDQNHFHDYVVLKLPKPVGKPLPVTRAQLEVEEDLYLPVFSGDHDNSLPNIGLLSMTVGSFTKTHSYAFLETKIKNGSVTGGSPILNSSGGIVGLPFGGNRDSTIWALSMNFINHRKAFLRNQIADIPPSLLSFLRKLEQKTEISFTTANMSDKQKIAITENLSSQRISIFCFNKAPNTKKILVMPEPFEFDILMSTKHGKDLKIKATIQIDDNPPLKQEEAYLAPSQPGVSGVTWNLTWQQLIQLKSGKKIKYISFSASGREFFRTSPFSLHGSTKHINSIKCER